jgi:hypothetical protein
VILILWLFFWLFVASGDSGRATTITEVDGKTHVEVRYDIAQRYRPYIPLVLVGVYGAVVGSVISVLVRRKPHAQRLLTALVFSPAFAVISVAVLYGILAVLIPSGFFHPRAHPSEKVMPTIGGLLLMFPGDCIFTGFPAILGGLGTAFLFPGDCTRRIAGTAPPPLPRLERT